MKRLSLQDLDALLRLSKSKQETVEAKLRSYESADFALTILLCGYACASEISHRGIPVTLPGLLTESALGRSCLEAWRACRNQRAAEDEHGTRVCEVYPLIDRSSFTHLANWHPFESRCERSLASHPFIPKQLAKALGGVLWEMTDNVVQHSSSSPAIPSRGVAVYFSTTEECGLVVMDAGRGALASLHSNPEWSELKDEAEALNAILTKCATRRPENDFGDGYRSLFRAIVDHNFQIVLWSGEALTIIEANHGERREVSKLVESLGGFAVALIYKKEKS